MDRALWLLWWLGLRSTLRRMWRSIGTVKGIVSVAVWLLMIGPGLIMFVVAFWMGAPPILPAEFVISVEQLERYGSLALLGLCLLTVVTISGKGALVVFLPVEVNFLLAAPLTRRQLLLYKLLPILWLFCFVSIVLWLMIWLLASCLHLPGTALAHSLGIVLTLVFLHLTAMNLTALGLIIGARAYSRVRRLIVWTVGMLVMGGLVFALWNLSSLGWSETMERLEQLPVTRALLEVPRCFVRAMLAERYWPDFVIWGGLSLTVDVLLLALLFKLDVQYEESAAAVGEKLYKQIARIRSQGASAVWSKNSGTARSRVPTLPWWGGAGPVAWRQLQSAARSRFLVVMLVLAPLLTVLTRYVMMRMLDRPDLASVAELVFFPSAVFAISLALPAISPFDFRNDLDRMEVLKSLPIGPMPLVLGQILVPVFWTTVVQGLCTAALTIVAGSLSTAAVLWTVLPLVLPLNFLLVGLDNIVFLLSPSRPLGAPAGDAFSGFKMILNLGKSIILSAAAGLALALAIATYFVSGGLLGLAVAIAWVVLAVFVVGVVALLAWAFQRFDVVRDRPG